MGINTWKSIGKALPNRLNIVLSRNENIDSQPNVLLLRGKAEVSALSKYLNCDLFVIGGAKTYENFADIVEKWIVTEIPDLVPDADTFMRADFLEGFLLKENQELEGGLRVKTYERV
jgi:dihydrofolate reductase